MRVSLPPLHHTSSRYSVWAHGQLYVCLEQYVSCETGRSCESVAPGIRFSDLPIAKCFLVICLPFLDESWNERSDDRELCRWQKATSCKWIAENLWRGCVEGHVARMGEIDAEFWSENVKIRRGQPKYSLEGGRDGSHSQAIPRCGLH